MYLTGFADEAAKDIDGQILATRELGWKHIEARNIDGTNLTDISDEKFDEVRDKLEAAGVQVNCFGSAIANWGKDVADPNETSLEETRRAIPRMKALGTGLIRIMSYGIRRDDEGNPLDQMKDKRFEKLREIVKMFTDEGLQPVHENCMNFGGMGWKYTRELVEKVPGLKLVFDTANPVNTPDYASGEPGRMQSAWDFYSHVKDHVAYVHIKDARYIGPQPGNIFPRSEFTWAGEGDGDVERIVRDLLDNGYDGGISMEPHLSVVFHDESVQSEDDVRFNNYVEYGRRFMKLLEDIGHRYHG